MYATLKETRENYISEVTVGYNTIISVKVEMIEEKEFLRFVSLLYLFEIFVSLQFKGRA